MAIAIHVRIQRGGRTAEVVQMMVEVELAQRYATDHVQHEQQVAREFMVGDHLQEDCERANEHEVRRGERNGANIKARLEMVVATAQLVAGADEAAGGQEGDDDSGQCRELRDERNPVGQRECIGDLADPRAALPPHQLSGIERDHDDQQEVVAAIHRLDHQVRDRIHLGAK